MLPMGNEFKSPMMTPDPPPPPPAKKKRRTSNAATVTNHAPQPPPPSPQDLLPPPLTGKIDQTYFSYNLNQGLATLWCQGSKK